MAPYRLVQIPHPLYNSWREIVWNMSDTKTMQQAVLRMLKAWVWARFPVDKLCAFEDFSAQEARRFRLEPGMYVILREMTHEELALNDQARKGEIPETDDPQWHLEAPDLKPYLNDNYQTNSLDHSERSGWPRLQGELRG
jgi:hypothetical protein